jgi:hypothetical protein
MCFLGYGHGFDLVIHSNVHIYISNLFKCTLLVNFTAFCKLSYEFRAEPQLYWNWDACGYLLVNEVYCISIKSTSEQTLACMMQSVIKFWTKPVDAMQLKHWQWIASYYMCAIGDVYQRHNTFSSLLEKWNNYNQKNKCFYCWKWFIELLIYQALQQQSSLKIQDIINILNKSICHLNLIDKIFWYYRIFLGELQTKIGSLHKTSSA